jgi:hypothetical protein
MAKKQTNWTRTYNEKAYDRLAITVPKGQKQAIQEHAEAKGQSINGLVNGLLQADMGLSEAEWRNPTKK